jgi:hypothetical protein
MTSGRCRMRQYESPVAVVVKGAIAGLVGTAAITAGKQRRPELMQQFGLGSADPPSESRVQGGQPPEEPTAKLAGKVATGVLEKPIEEGTRERAGQAIHWAYGAAWGALYGVLQGTLRWPLPLSGTFFGLIVGAVASTAVPAMRLTPPPTRQPASMNVMQTVLHLLYGWVTALVFGLLASKK